MSETKSTLRPALFQLLQLVALLGHEQFGVTDDANEEDMPDLQLNFFLNLSGHPVRLRENKAIDNCALC